MLSKRKYDERLLSRDDQSLFITFSLILTVAPLSNKAVTHSKWPENDAKCNGVCPSCKEAHQRHILS